MDVTLSVFSSNISSVLSIYQDSEKIRLENKNQLLEKLEKDANWTNSEFEQFSHYEFHFEWLLIHSLFISAYSYFENFMFSIARQIEKKTESEIKLNDIRGKGDLDCYRKYINKIGEIKAAKNDSKNWNQISEFKAIRNSIIHKYGVMDKKVNLIKKYDLYFGPSEKMIRVKNIKFLEDFCALSIEYMNEIVNEIKEKNYSS
ncbi:hypothetical protein [Aestuariibaculum marinum]|uniref:RiboL-PSP-HEPN domain-containing protein n=1 Tax=Aestuariibaculum marinum TaxID=2683592 RepID=A0A8J6PZX9_9FLAO|nr:hypothetical protein [Aestuariibaculum marinum]MBD0825503.1 hypothetical protein [Aestuariibaculum marinum]